MSQPNDKHIREATTAILTLQGELRVAERGRDGHEFAARMLEGKVIDLKERIKATERTKELLEEAQS